MPNVTVPAQGLISIEFTQAQVLHLAAAMASGLVGSSHLPAMFTQEQWKLYGMFMEHLTPADQKRVEDSMHEQEESL
jgi:hypothetical protein